MTYLSSKMTGLKDLGVSNFQREAAKLRARGEEVLVPSTEGETSWVDFIVRDLKDLEGCDKIHLFGRWYTSPGALVELLGSIRMDKEIEIAQWYFRPLQWVFNRLRYKNA